ncbi:prepilin peptidase, partial [Escherichia coli]
MELFYFYPWLFPVLATLFGLIVGSFLNVVIYRLP